MATVARRQLRSQLFFAVTFYRDPGEYQSPEGRYSHWIPACAGMMDISGFTLNPSD